MPYDPSGLDPYTYGVFKIESNFDPHAVTGSNVGLGQFGPQEQRRYGITDPYSAQQNIDALQREKAEHSQIYKSRFGSDPSHGQLYLMHQQGEAGGPALMSADPSTPAWKAIRQYYNSDRVAQRAITGNIPKDSPLYGRDVNSIGAGDFSNYWINRFSGGSGTAVASASPAVAPPLAAGNAPASPSDPAPQTGGSPGTDPNGNPLSKVANAMQQQPMQPAQFAPLQPMQRPPMSAIQAQLIRNMMAGAMQDDGSGQA